MADVSISHRVKRCTICRVEKPASPEFFGLNNRSDGKGDGLTASCRPCHNARARAWVATRKADPGAPKCSSQLCERRAIVGRYCEAHAQRVAKLQCDAPEKPIRVTERRLHQGCLVEGCARKVYRRDLCNGHYLRWRRHSDPTGGKHLRRHGEKMITRDGYVRVIAKGNPKAKSGRVAEHRLVMEKMLGRELLPTETIHHKNGVRHDNRPENLELWISSHPPGQRPKDMVAWAKQILEIYNDELLTKLG